MNAPRIEHYETIIVGGGQAGLAVAAQLAARDVDYLVVTDEARIGDNWRRRWDSLRLFTPARYSGLPALPFPAEPAHFADKDEVADYLERYATRCDLHVRTSTRVQHVTAHGAGFRLQLADDRSILEADNVIVATGPFQQPRRPALAARIGPDIAQWHSSEYRNPFELTDGPVLVVGAGSSGSQIALELARFRKVWLSGRQAGHIPREVLGRDVFDWIWPPLTALTADTMLGRRLRRNAAATSDSRIGISERALRDAQIERVGRFVDVRGGLPVCGDAVVEPRVIIWCTGFQSDYRWISLPAFDAAGAPIHQRGVSSAVPGLFFVGLRFQHRLTSSLIGGVGADAAFIAARVAERTSAAPDARQAEARAS
jgi:putative flavoprotein involved in K+ transport